MRRVIAVALILTLVAGSLGYVAGTRDLLAPRQAEAATAACITFPETGKQVCDRFLEYWQQNGGLAQQGLPLSDEFQEVSAVDGKTYTVQYFERAVFEKHPENARPYDVLLTLLGREKYLAKYPNGPGGPAPSPSAQPTPPPAQGWPRTASTSQVSLTVYEVRDPQPPPQYAPPEPGTRYLALDVSLRNVGTKTFSTNKLYFYLRGSDGRDYQVTFVSAPEPQVALRDLTPNDDTRGWITFEVPTGVQVVRVSFDHALLDGAVSISLTP